MTTYMTKAEMQDMLARMDAITKAAAEQACTPDAVTYGVNLWGSRPGTNDDCWAGHDYTNRAAALGAYDDPFGGCYFHVSYNDPHRELWVELAGPGLHEVRCIWKGDAKVQGEPDLEWQREIAMQAGMGLGVDAYNDEMGY